ncbi:MAG: hypothetical protein ACRD1Z_06070 [Vicinamibacteria bacterium]
MDIAVWLDDLGDLDRLRKIVGRALTELFHDTGIGVAHHQVEVFLMEPGTNRYLGRLCGFNRCPKWIRRSSCVFDPASGYGSYVTPAFPPAAAASEAHSRPVPGLPALGAFFPLDAVPGSPYTRAQTPEWGRGHCGGIPRPRSGVASPAD